MATLSQAAQVRDRIADALLDGKLVHSVGIQSKNGDYSVGVTTSRRIELPNLPPDLANVAVDVVVIDESVASHRR